MDTPIPVDARGLPRGARAALLAVLLGLLTCPPPILAQVDVSPLQRVRGSGLDSAIVGQVTTFFAPEDRSYATELAALADSAAAWFGWKFQGGFPLYLAVLRPDSWFDPYQEGTPAPYGLPWGWIPESLMGVPASLRAGVLITGPDEQADLRRVRFVMLHEYGHLAARRHLHPGGDQLYSSVRWFEELLATYFAYAFLQQSDPKWARAARQEWRELVDADPPASATLDWSFMFQLPPREFGRTYAWYQNLLNLRAASIHSEHGVAFLDQVRDRLPWSSADEWTTETLLPLLDSIAPGFQAWADGLEDGSYVTRPPLGEGES